MNLIHLEVILNRRSLFIFMIFKKTTLFLQSSRELYISGILCEAHIKVNFYNSKSSINA